MSAHPKEVRRQALEAIVALIDQNRVQLSGQAAGGVDPEAFTEAVDEIVDTLRGEARFITTALRLAGPGPGDSKRWPSAREAILDLLGHAPEGLNKLELADATGYAPATVAYQITALSRWTQPPLIARGPRGRWVLAGSGDQQPSIDPVEVS